MFVFGNRLFWMIKMVVILGLAATSGGEGDSKLLLWNVSTGELASDLNAA
jgi:hypothetical protein